MSESESVEGFWSDPDLVDHYSKQSDALPYETDLIQRVVRQAEQTGSVRLIHVIGVGAGRELPAICAAAPGARIHAWDISTGMVEACRRAVQDRGLNNVTVERADVSEMSPTEPGADVVISLGAVLGFCVPREARRNDFATIASLLRPGGTFALMVQQRGGRPDWLAWLTVRSALTKVRLASGEPGDRWSRHGDSRVMFHHFGRNELLRICRRAGFDDLQLQSLRQWGRGRGHQIPLKSPNPLILSARMPITKVGK